jgi:hypothetical protein
MSGTAVTLQLMTKIIASGDPRAGQRGIKLDIAVSASHTPRGNIELVIVLMQLRELGSIAVAAQNPGPLTSQLLAGRPCEVERREVGAVRRTC